MNTQCQRPLSIYQLFELFNWNYSVFWKNLRFQKRLLKMIILDILCIYPAIDNFLKKIIISIEYNIVKIPEFTLGS